MPADEWLYCWGQNHPPLQLWCVPLSISTHHTEAVDSKSSLFHGSLGCYLRTRWLSEPRKRIYGECCIFLDRCMCLWGEVSWEVLWFEAGVSWVSWTQIFTCELCTTIECVEEDLCLWVPLDTNQRGDQLTRPIALDFSQVESDNFMITALAVWVKLKC